MRNFILKIPFYCLLLTIFTLPNACKPEQGCTDPHARNFNAQADDSCCCRYNGYLLFWHNSTTAGNLYYFSGVSKLKYYVDSSEVGTMSVFRFVRNSPPCGYDSAFTAVIDLGTEKSRTIHYKVVGNNGTTYWSGITELKADTCVKTRLRFK